MVLENSEESQEHVTNNQGDLPSTEESGGELPETTPTTEETGEKETTSETGEEKPEFSDENMQKRFTQKMQELSEKEKKISGEASHLNDKAKAFDILSANQNFREWYKDYKQNTNKQSVPDITEEEWLSASQDKAKFQELLDKRVKLQRDPEVDNLKKDVNLIKLTSDIDRFANAENEKNELVHPDFWELDDKNLIEPYLSAFKSIPISGAQKLEWAWKLARHDTRDKDAVIKAHKLVEEKKKASGDKGVSHETKTVSKTPMSLRDFYRKEAKRLGMNEAP